VRLAMSGLLAEAENEKWSNNSTGMFKEAVGPLHVQYQARLSVCQLRGEPKPSHSLGPHTAAPSRAFRD
jgi:hypothetical protein